MKRGSHFGAMLCSIYRNYTKSVGLCLLLSAATNVDKETGQPAKLQ